MFSDQWTRIISASVAPVVIISASGLLCLAFYNRLAAVVTRLRGFHREQWQEQEALAKLRRTGDDDVAGAPAGDAGDAAGADRQRTRRSRLIRLTLACLLLTIALLAACSLTLGLSVAVPAAGYAAVPLFSLGLILLMTSMIFALLELRKAIDPVEIEGRFMHRLEQDLAETGNGSGL